MKSCDTSARIKPTRHVPPIDFPNLCRQLRSVGIQVSMDFIVGLPESNSFDTIIVIVDRLTKMAHSTLSPLLTLLELQHCSEISSSSITAFQEILSPTMVLLSNLSLPTPCAIWLGMNKGCPLPTTPQTDSQTERVNAIRKQYLCGFWHYP